MMRNMSKMAKLVLILLTVTIASFVIAGVIFYAEYGSNNFAGINGDILRPSGSIDVDEEKTQSITGISNIYVNTTSDEINFIKTDSKELKANFHGYYSSSSKEYKPELTVTTSGSEIRIKVDYKPNTGVFMFNSNLKLDIYLPAAYTKNLDVHTTSADVNIDEITSLEGFNCKTLSGSLKAKLVNAGKAELTTTSGNMSINGTYDSIISNSLSGEIKSAGITAKTASFDTTSGNIRLNVTADDLKLHSLSGEVTAEPVNVKSCRAETTSGTINLRGNPGRLEAISVSGEVKLEYGEFSNDINVRTTSGGADIRLPETAEFHLNYKTASGNSRVDFPVTVSGTVGRKGIEGTVVSDRNSINVTTISGSLDITK